MTVTFEHAPSQREILSFWQRGKVKEDRHILTVSFLFYDIIQTDTMS